MKKLAYMLKTSKILYSIYFYSMSAILKLWGLFLPIDDKLILFNSFGGKKYDDSPKTIYEQIKQDPRFKGYCFVWAIQEPDNVLLPQDAIVVKADTLAYFKTALKARVWITNSSMERGLKFKKKGTLCFNTWHGTAIKKMGIDIANENQSFRVKGNVQADIMLAQGQYDIDVFSHAFEMPKEKFRCIGLPRNDILTNCTLAEIKQIRQKLNIPQSKKVLLYAPTFREYEKGQDHQCVLTIPIDLSHWQKVLGDEYVVLFRAHYEVADHMNVSQYPLFMDVSNYPVLTDLMIASDALISDYSSIYFDYSVMDKPMYCFAYDYDKYTQNRGMYLNLKEELPCVIHQSEEDLLQELLRLSEDYVENAAETKKFRDKYVTAYGSAAKQSCDILYKEIG